jgi:hypothetical protein
MHHVREREDSPHEVAHAGYDRHLIARDSGVCGDERPAPLSARGPSPQPHELDVRLVCERGEDACHEERADDLRTGRVLADHREQALGDRPAGVAGDDDVLVVPCPRGDLPREEDEEACRQNERVKYAVVK